MNRRLRTSAWLIAALWLAPVLWQTPAACAAGDPLRVLVVYGGHAFETNHFLQIFRANPAISLQTAEYPHAEAWFARARAQDYDVLVFYDMWPRLSGQGQSNLVALIRDGKPLVALHHTLASFPDWDEYANIIGGRYHQKPWRQGNAQNPASTYLHDVEFQVRIADRSHPVTRGLKDFAIHDETYGGFEVKPGSHVLLTTDHPTSGRDIAWWRTYGAARIVYIQLGHDRQAYRNPNYRQLLAQAIEWVSKRADR